MTTTLLLWAVAGEAVPIACVLFIPNMLKCLFRAIKEHTIIPLVQQQGVWQLEAQTFEVEGSGAATNTDVAVDTDVDGCYPLTVRDGRGK